MSYSIDDLELIRRRNEEMNSRSAEAATVNPATPTQPTGEEVQEQQQIQEELSEQQQERAEASERIATAAEESQKVEKERGPVTELGEFLGYISRGGYFSDATNALAAALNDAAGGNLQGLEDFFASDDEIQQTLERAGQRRIERRRAGEMSTVEQVGDSILDTTTAVSSALENTIAIPFTIAGAITNQATPWADPPASVKDDPLANAIFEIGSVVFPTLFLGAVGGPIVSGVGGTGLKGNLIRGGITLAGESAIETVQQDSMDDLLAGRQIARGFGEIAESLGYDGEQVTRDLIEGKEVDAQLAIRITAFFHNLGINGLAEGGFRIIGRAFRNKPSKQVKEVAERLGKDVDEVTASLDNVKTPEFSTTTEPHDLFDIDTQASVPTPNGDEVKDFFVDRSTTEELFGIPVKPMSQFASDLRRAAQMGNPQMIRNVLIKELDRLKRAAEFEGFDFGKPKEDLGPLYPNPVEPDFENDFERFVFHSDPDKFWESADLPEGFKQQWDELLEQDPELKRLWESLSDPKRRAGFTDVARATEDATQRGPRYVNEEALTLNAARILQTGGGIARSTDADLSRPYFSSLKPITSNSEFTDALAEATDTLVRLTKASEDRDILLGKANAWLADFYDETDDVFDIDSAIENFPKTLVEYIDNAARATGEGLKSKGRFSVETFARELGLTSREGFTVASILAEEIGARLRGLAQQISVLDAKGIDSKHLMDLYMELKKKAELVLIPLRRAKRMWNVEGQIQNAKNIERAKDADILDPDGSIQRALKQVDPDREYILGPEGQISAPEQLYEDYKGGNTTAGEILKDYFRAMGFGDPEKALAKLDNLDTVLYRQLKSGYGNMARKSHYAMMLTNIQTHVASMASGTARLVFDPIGAIATKDRGNVAFGVGQLVGGLTAMRGAFRNARRVARTGQLINSGTKADVDFVQAAKASEALDQLWQGTKAELASRNATGWEHAVAAFNYWTQKMALNPAFNIAGRFLAAGDEMVKTIYGAQVATGKAYRDAWTGVGVQAADRSPEHIKKLTKKYLHDTFLDGNINNKIIDAEVLEGAKSVTMQTDIPKGTGPVASLMKNLQNASEGSAIMAWVFPFTRVAYNSLDLTMVMGMGAVPFLGKGLAKVLPKYKKILAGEAGELAKIQMESMMAFSQMSVFTVGGLATMGAMTGYDPPTGMPKTSFIIPAPGTEDGYVAVPYGRLEPYASIWGITADLTQQFTTGSISKGTYDQLMGEVLNSVMLATLDKTFLTGLENVTELLNVDDFSAASAGVFASSVAQATGSLLGLGPILGATRTATGILNPNKGVARVNEDYFANGRNAIRARMFGGIGNPTIYDPMQGGRPISKSARFGSDNWFAAVASNLVDEFLTPGKTSNVDPNNPIYREFEAIDYDYNAYALVRNYGEMNLTDQQMSMLSKDLHDVSNLESRLNNLFNSKEYKRLKNRLAAEREENLLGSVGGTNSRGSRTLEAMRSMVSETIREAKRYAIQNGQLSRDSDFVEAVAAADARRRGNFKLPGVSNNNDDLNTLLVPTR